MVNGQGVCLKHGIHRFFNNSDGLNAKSIVGKKNCKLYLSIFQSFSSQLHTVYRNVMLRFGAKCDSYYLRSFMVFISQARPATLEIDGHFVASSTI